MKTLVPAVGKSIPNESIRALAEHNGLTFNKMKKHHRDMAAGANLYLNDTYQVDMRQADHVPGWPAITWLSIKRIDKAPVGEERFRDFQDIKNQLCGPEAEAVEIYPAESRLVDAANQYHLWVIAEGRIPFGFNTRVVSYVNVGGSVQKPL